MRIYTKTGDKGQTSLFDGTRVGKDTLRIDILGKLDEVNSSLGVVSSHLEEQVIVSGARSDQASRNSASEKLLNEAAQELLNIQSTLFELGAIVAGGLSSHIDKISNHLNSEALRLETTMDKWSEILPTLRNFILPGGTVPASHCHHSRSLVRTLERGLTNLHREAPLPESLLIYINRLSDYLFTLARVINHALGCEEQIWKSLLP